MTWAAAERSLRGRGPPPVPRRITRVLADCADAECGHSAAAMAAAPAARTLRRSMRLPALMSVIDSERVRAFDERLGQSVAWKCRPRVSGPSHIRMITSVPDPAMLEAIAVGSDKPRS